MAAVSLILVRRVLWFVLAAVVVLGGLHVHRDGASRATVLPWVLAVLHVGTATVGAYRMRLRDGETGTAVSVLVGIQSLAHVGTWLCVTFGPIGAHQPGPVGGPALLGFFITCAYVGGLALMACRRAGLFFAAQVGVLLLFAMMVVGG